MKHVKRSVLLWYSPREIYGLVTSVEDYPQFLPWCERGEVVERHDDGMTARLHLAYAGVRHAFTTRNTHVTDREVVMGLVDGPFSVLDGTWRFTPLAVPGSEAENACRVEFDLRYAFARGALESLVSPVFDRIANTFVDAFVRRADALHLRA
jgi:ribosome-associated toxin RatA of RatAB toxin-antitoxin module